MAADIFPTLRTDFVGREDVLRLEAVGQAEDDGLGEGGHQHVPRHHHVGALFPAATEGRQTVTSLSRVDWGMKDGDSRHDIPLFSQEWRHHVYWSHRASSDMKG